jgi:hypothetical protein
MLPCSTGRIAGLEQEWYAAPGQHTGHRRSGPHLEPEVENGSAALGTFDKAQCLGKVVGGTNHGRACGLENVLQIHRNERIVLDNQNIPALQRPSWLYITLGRSGA